jgi:hypothetical protein
MELPEKVGVVVPDAGQGMMVLPYPGRSDRAAQIEHDRVRAGEVVLTRVRERLASIIVEGGNMSL